jgi:hypothetical protein
MLSLIKSIKEKAHKVSTLESLRTAVHNISAPQASTNDAEPGQAEGTKICYNPRLIVELIKEQKLLMSQLMEIEVALVNSNPSEIHKKLDAFNATLGDHILKKNIKLYIYMQYSMKKNNNKDVNLATFKRNMTATSRLANTFINEHESTLSKGRVKPSLADDLTAIIKEIADHTENEKTGLFPYYLPPEAYI